MTDLIYQFGFREPPPSAENDLFPSRNWIIQGLIEMRKAGVVRMVYCDANKLAIVLPSVNDLEGKVRQWIPWTEALKMVEQFRAANAPAPVLVERKQPTRSQISNEAKAKCK